MNNYILKFDDAVESYGFLTESVNKYFYNFWNEKLKEKVTTLNFVKVKGESERFTVSFLNKELNFLGSDRGLIYALYYFFEKLGWRFFNPNCEVLLSDKCLLNFDSDFDFSFEPKFEYRLGLWSDINTEWAIKNGLNAFYSTHLPKSFGGSINYAGYPVHTLGMFVPADKYFEEHPEYFALSDTGERKKGQLCLSNDNVFEIVVSEAKKWLDNNDDASIISISINDNFCECHCDECKKIKKDGTASDVNVYFVNKIANELAKDYPNIKVQTIAYNHMIEAPKYHVPAKNVIVEICPLNSCENHAVDDDNCLNNKTFLRQLNDWKKLTDNIFLWKYYSSFSYFITPFQILAKQRKSFNFYSKNGVKGIFAEGAHFGNSTNFSELRAYIITKLTFNPDMTGEEYKEKIVEFCVCYYGEEAGQCMLEYLSLLEEVSEKYHYNCYPMPYNIISANPNEEKNYTYFINNAKKIFNKAFSLTTSEEFLNRVEKEYIAVLYYSYYTTFEESMMNGNEEERDLILKEQKSLFELIDKYKIERVRSYILTKVRALKSNLIEKNK